MTKKRTVIIAGAACSPTEQRHANYAIVRDICIAILGIRATVDEATNHCQVTFTNTLDKQHKAIGLTLTKEMVGEFITALQEAQGQMKDDKATFQLVRNFKTGRIVWQNPAVALLAKNLGGERNKRFITIGDDEPES